MADRRQAWVTEEQFTAWLSSLPDELRVEVVSYRERLGLREQNAALRAELAELRKGGQANGG